MMKRKALKVAILASLVALIALAIGVTVSSAKSKGELPEYLGSKACLGCHVEEFEKWEMTGHSHMLSQVFKLSDLPGDINLATDAQKAELQKAAWVVAKQRFLARDPKSGALVYLNVQWNGSKYVDYKGGSNWETSCAGCHTTGWDEKELEFGDPGIGCEACHGPGRDHVLGKGDISKIVKTDNADACGQCHLGGAMPNGNRWAPDYKPGEDFLASTGFKMPDVTPNGTDALFAPVGHNRQYPYFIESGHNNSIESLESSGHASASCYGCHAAEAFADKLDGKTLSKTSYEDGITCSACHDPHEKSNEAQLRMPADQLCIACHTGSLPEGGSLKPGSTAHHPMKEMLAGYGAIDVKQTKGPHSELSCVECHMTEGNHLMNVIKPGDVVGTTRKDTCTACHAHENSSAESRDVYLTMWQESTVNRMEKAKADIAVIDAALKANPSALSAELKLKYDSAKTNITFVEADASKGVHNFEYVFNILNSANKSLSEVRKAIGK